MSNWQSFLESKSSEKAEEKSGLDLDHDGEKGESKEHKDKIKKAKDGLLEFFKKRKAGAEKIASEARAKGGPSMLTAWHFAAKSKPYSEVLSAIKNNRDESFYLNKCQQLANKLKFKKLKQKEFQEIMGELEVVGEALAEIFN